ncbi:MAG: PEP-CTERM sorting domain-containing protein [Planctomycetota bacterium]|nr:PEP-CTERM sorting domain-containing protein [Planctomycetota bacterium]
MMNWGSGGRGTSVVAALVMAIMLQGMPAKAADSLYGIHWWGWGGPGSSFDTTPGTMLGTNTMRAWTTETIITNSASWWQAPYFAGLYTNLASNNARAITRIDYDWGQTVPASTTVSAATWANTIVGTVNTLKHGSNIWQIGNEPNLNGEGNGWTNNQVTPAGYAQIYRAARSAIHSNAQASPLGAHQVLVAPPSPGAPIGGVRWMDGGQWLTQVLNAIPANEVDGIGLHAYGDTSKTAAESLKGFRISVAEQMALIKAVGMGAKPVYITEFGQASTNATQEANAAALARGAYDALAKWNKVPGNQNIVAANWFVYDNTNQGAGSWDNWSVEYWKNNGNAAGNNGDLYTAIQQSVAKQYPAGAQGATPLPSSLQIMDDFETNNGRWNSSLTASPYSTGFVSGSSSIARTAEDSYTNSYSQKLTIVDSTSSSTPWKVRHLSGLANPNNNQQIPVSNTTADGFIGVMMKTTTPGMSLQLVLDTTKPSTTAGLTAGISQSLIADNEWHLYEWNLDATNYTSFPGVSGPGVIPPSGNVWVNSLLIQGVNANATIFFDSVMYRKDGSLYQMVPGMAAPEPEPVPLAGDLDGNGFVGQNDLNRILARWGTNVTAGDWFLGDPNGDGFVGQGDLNIVLANWGAEADVVAVPEPASVVLLGLAGAGLFMVWLRR